MSQNRSLRRVLSTWKRWPSDGYQELNPSPSMPKKRRPHPSSSLVFDNKENLTPPPAPLGPSSSKKSKSSVPVVAGKEGHENKLFLVEPHILKHWLFQDLMEKSWVQAEWGREDWIEMEAEYRNATGKKGESVRPICLDCDAILFEFFLWLVENDDPSLRDLNLHDLMEFYDTES